MGAFQLLRGCAGPAGTSHDCAWWRAGDIPSAVVVCSCSCHEETPPLAGTLADEAMTARAFDALGPQAMI